MLKLIRKKDVLNFSSRSHTKLGIISAIMGFASVTGFITVSIVSSIMKGEGGMIFGIIGILLFALSAFGFFLSYKALKQSDIYYRFPVIGVVLNSFMTVLMMIIYIVGYGG